MNKNLSLEEQKKLWHELAEIVIANEQRKIEDWLKEKGLFEEYERVKECEG